jgi:putative endonuclease
MKGYMYILECCDGSYYTGSTKYIDLRLAQHQAGEGANHTKKRLPVKLLYYEEFNRIDEAFYREKQVQGWSRKKKEALMNKNYKRLHLEAECKNESHYGGFGSAGFGSAGFGSAQPAENDTSGFGSAQPSVSPRPRSLSVVEGEGEGKEKGNENQIKQ